MLSRTHLMMLIILSTGLINHVLLIPILLDAAGRDAWLSVLFATLPGMAWGTAVFATVRRVGDNRLQQFLNDRGLPLLAWFVLPILSAYVILMGTITMKDTMDWLELVYLPYTPKWTISLVFAFLCVVTARLGVRVIGIVGGVVLPFVGALGFFVMTANMPHKHYDLLLPLVESGWMPIARGGTYIMSGYTELILVLLLTHRLRRKPSVGSAVMLVVVLALLTAGPLIGAISEFGPSEAAKQRFPAYEQWRLVRIGRYIEHVDFFSLYQWLSGAWVRISLSVYLVADLFEARPHLARWTTFLLGGLLFAAGVAPISPVVFRDFLAGIYFPASIVAALAVLAAVALAGIRKATLHKRGIEE